MLLVKSRITSMWFVLLRNLGRAFSKLVRELSLLPLMDLSTLTADYYSFSMPVISHKITNLTITHQNQNENKGCSRVTFAYSFHTIATLSCCVSYYSITSVRGCLWVPRPQQIKLLQITCSVLLDHSLKILIDRISPPIHHQSSYLLVVFPRKWIPLAQPFITSLSARQLLRAFSCTVRRQKNEGATREGLGQAGVLLSLLSVWGSDVELDECIFFMCSVSDEDLITKLKPRVLESLCCQKLFFSEQFQVSLQLIPDFLVHLCFHNHR